MSLAYKGKGIMLTVGDKEDSKLLSCVAQWPHPLV